MNVYIWYFIVILLVILCIFLILTLMLKGYKIVYEKRENKIATVTRKLKDIRTSKPILRVRRTINFTRHENNAFYYLEKDYPDFDVEKTKEDLKKYIVSFLKNGTASGIKTTGTFKCEIEDLYQNSDVDKDSIRVIRTIIGNYTKKGDITTLSFNTQVEYNTNYESGLARNVEKHYISEFICNTRNSYNKKIKNNNVKNTEHSEYDDLETGVWYLNKLS